MITRAQLGEGRLASDFIFCHIMYNVKRRFNSAPRHLNLYIMVIWIIYIAMSVAVVSLFVREVKDYAKMWKEWTNDEND